MQEGRREGDQKGRRIGENEGAFEATCRGLPHYKPPGLSHGHHTQSSPSLGVGNVW